MHIWPHTWHIPSLSHSSFQRSYNAWWGMQITSDVFVLNVVYIKWCWLPYVISRPRKLVETVPPCTFILVAPFRMSAWTLSSLRVLFFFSCSSDSYYDGTLNYRMATSCGWAVRGSNCGRGSWSFSSRNHPDLHWGPPSMLFSGCGGKAAGARSWPLICV